MAAAPPTIGVTATQAPAEVEFRSGKGPDTDSFPIGTALVFDQRGQRTQVTLPDGVDPTDTVHVMRVLSGIVQTSIHSLTPVQTEFRTRRSRPT